MNWSTEESDFISAHLSPRTGQGQQKMTICLLAPKRYHNHEMNLVISSGEL